MNVFDEEIRGVPKTQTIRPDSYEKKDVLRNTRLLDKMELVTDSKDTTPNKGQSGLQSSQVANGRTPKKQKKGRDSLQDLAKKVLQYLLESEGNKFNRIDLMRQLGVKRRKMYDALTISVSLKIITQTDSNQYRLAGTQSLRELIKSATHKKALQQCNTKQQPNGTKIRKRSLEGSSQLSKLTLDVLRVLLEAGKTITIQQINKTMGPFFSHVTRIKRIYDIVNVFCAYGLIQKTKFTTRIIGYQWIGLDTFQKLVNTPQLDGKVKKTPRDDVHIPHTQKSQNQPVMPQTPTLQLHQSPNPCPFVYFAVNRLDLIKLLQQPMVNQPMWYLLPMFPQTIPVETTPTKQQGFHRTQHQTRN